MLSHCPRPFTRVGPLLIVALAGVGCRSPLHPPANGWTFEESFVQPQSSAAAPTPSAATDGPLPADPDALVALAMQRNPALRAAEARVARLAQRPEQAEALDDPTLSVVPLGEQAQTAAGRVGLVAGLSQKLPFPGKLDARAAAAGRETAAAHARLAALRITVATSVRKSWWALQYARGAGVVLNDERRLREQLRDAAAARYRAGTAEQADLLRAGVEVDALRQQLLDLDAQRTTAAARLNRLLDRPSDAPLPVAQARVGGGDLDSNDAPPPLEAHPRLRELHATAAAWAERRRLARLNRYPDFTASLNYARVDDRGDSPVADGDDQWSVGFGLTLPLNQNKRTAAIREAIAGGHETAAALADERNRLAFEVTDAGARVDAGRQALALYRERMLPEARQAVEAATSSYRAGRGDFTALIETARRMTSLRLMELRTQTQLHQDRADLAAARGSSPPSSPAAKPAGDAGTSSAASP